MPKVKYLETPLTNDKGIREESKRNHLLPFSPHLLIARSISINIRSKYAERMHFLLLFCME
jgi:hypothetical protein